MCLFLQGSCRLCRAESRSRAYPRADTADAAPGECCPHEYPSTLLDESSDRPRSYTNSVFPEETLKRALSNTVAW